MEIINNTIWTLEQVKAMKKIGVCRNEWRQKYVTIYELPPHTPPTNDVVSIGETFDGKRIVVCRESRDGHRNAIADFPRTYIYR